MVKQLLRLCAVLLSLSACNGGNPSSINTENTPANAITIDNAGILPILDNNPTTSLIYLHNNTNSTISDIKFTVQSNNTSSPILSLTSRLMAKIGIATNLISSSNATACSIIAAFQSCPLSLTTPSGSSQGSLLITASYMANRHAQSFSNLVNYSSIKNNSAHGAVITSGVQLNSFGNSHGYAMIYLYGSGHNAGATLTSLELNNPTVTLSHGSGTQINSNQVQAVEITAPAVTNGLSATLMAKSLQNQQNFVSIQSLGVTPSKHGAILTTGQVPLINSATTNPGSTLYVVNSGNTRATALSTAFASGISASTDNCNGQSLAPGAACTISFTVSQAGGSGNITLNYSGSSSVIQNVTWYNGTAGVVLQMAANPAPLIFSESASSVVTVTNSGGYPLTNLSIPTPTVISGSATANITSDNCSGQTLQLGASCNYSVTLTDSATDISAQVNLAIAGNYNNAMPQTYTRSLPLTYTAMAPVNLYFGTTGGTVYNNNLLVPGSGSMIVPANSQLNALAVANGMVYAAGLAYVWANLNGAWESYGGSQINDGNDWVNSLVAANNIAYAATTGNSCPTPSECGNVWYATSFSSGWQAVGNAPFPEGADIQALALSGNNLYAADDAGNVWVTATTNLATATWEPVANNGLINTGTIIYALAVANDGRVFAGANSGLVWQAVAGNWESVNGGPIPGAHANSVNSLALFNGNIYAGTNDGNIWESVNGSWSSLCGGPVNGGSSTILTSMVIDQSGGVYAGTLNNSYGPSGYSSVWYCSGLSANWVLKPGMGISGTLDNSSAEFPATPLAESLGIIYAGTGGGNVFMQTSSGWSGVVQGSLDNSFVQTLSSESAGIIIAGTYNGNVWRLNNGLWSQLSGNGYHGALDGSSTQYSSVYAVAASENIIYASTFNGNVWQYANGLWTQKSGSGSQGSLDGSSVNTLALTANNLYAGTANGNVWLLSTGQWLQQSGTANQGAIDGSAINTLAAAGSNLYAGTANGNVWMLNAGQWLQESGTANQGSLDGTPVLAVTVSGNNLYAGTATGNVWLFNDGQWLQQSGNGGPGSTLDGSSVWSMAASATSVYAGTLNGGVWEESDNSWSSFAELPFFQI